MTFTPDPDQRQVLDHEHGTLLALGGPGSGKSAVLVERFATLVEGGADPERIVLFSLSRRGAQAARERILRRLGRSLPDLPALTYHGFANRVVGMHHAELDYPEPPRLLTAPEQYSRVAELLAGEDAARWPVLGAYLASRRFAREVADFVLRAQERMLDAEAMGRMATERERSDLAEVATFYGRYLDAIQGAQEVDFAGLLVQALAVLLREGAPGVDHLLIDDLQDVTPVGAAILEVLEGAAGSTVSAADPDGHVFSFRGASGEPMARMRERSDVRTVELRGNHRLEPGMSALVAALGRGERTEVDGIAAWRFLQPAEEADAVAREVLRTHLEEAVPWGDMAVILRRYGEYLPVLRRSFIHHGVPFLVLGESSSLLAEPAVRPIVQLLQYALRPDRRADLVEGLLVSPVVGLHPHDVRELRRRAKLAERGTTILDVVGRPPDDLAPDVTERLAWFRSVTDEIEDLAGRLPPDAVFSALWERLPHLAELVERADAPAGASAANRDLDALYAFSRSLARFGERRPSAALTEYLDVLEQVEFGPDPFVPPEERSPDAVRVVTAHRAHGEDFRVAFVVGCLEGEFPSLSAIRPMVDADDLSAPRTARQRFEERFREERALFRLAVSRGRRVILTSSEAQDSRKPRTPSRFLPPTAWSPVPAAGDPPTLALAEAEHRRTLATEGAAPAARFAALAALAAIPSHPEAWWGARTWTAGPPLHEGEMRTSYSRLSTFENCPLQYLYATELGLDVWSSHHAWLGSRIHELIEKFWSGEIPRTKEGMEAEIDRMWRPAVFPGRAVERRRRQDASRMIDKFLETEAAMQPAVVEYGFEIPVDGAVLRGRIDAVIRSPDGTVRVTDYKTSRQAIGQGEAAEDLQLGAYLLAVRKDDTLLALGNPSSLELVYLGTGDKGTIRRHHMPRPEDVAKFEARIAGYVGLIRDEAFAPSADASCRNCAFKTICPLWREGTEVTL